jgi:hypothetical protein
MQKKRTHLHFQNWIELAAAERREREYKYWFSDSFRTVKGYSRMGQPQINIFYY